MAERLHPGTSEHKPGQLFTRIAFGVAVLLLGFVGLDLALKGGMHWAAKAV